MKPVCQLVAIGDADLIQMKRACGFPNASVLREQYLRTVNGDIAKDPMTGKGRRIDQVVIEDG